MVYQVGKMMLQKTQDVFCGKINDVIVCRDLANGGNDFYTVIVIYDRMTAKKLMQLFHADEMSKCSKFVADYIWKESYLMVFEYEKERPLKQFFVSEILTLNECEQMGLNLVLEILSGSIPYPVLYLQLKQRQIHISKEKKIYFGYRLDLEEFSENITQKECATLCARIIFDFMKERDAQKATSYQLLEKKLWKGSYQQFTELYKDLQMTAMPLEKEGVCKKIQKWWKSNSDKIFKLLMFICMILGMIAFLTIVSQMIFSDIPFLKLFYNPLKQIGTESLLQ